MRAYIFNHILVGGSPLESEALVAEIIKTAQSLPGYWQWCRHTHEIAHRAEEWAKCIQNSHYFHYGDVQGKYKSKARSTETESELEPAIIGLPSWNQQQSQAARERIRKAIAKLLEQECLPISATARFRALTQHGIGGGSLYRHRDLWHPQYLKEGSFPSITDQTDSSITVDETSQGSSTSLLSTAGGDNAPAKELDESFDQDLDAGGNAHIDYSSATASFVQQNLFDLAIWMQAEQAAVEELKAQAPLRDKIELQLQIERMRQYLESDDPILMAEAMAWTQLNCEQCDEYVLAAISVKLSMYRVITDANTAQFWFLLDQFVDLNNVQLQQWLNWLKFLIGSE
jgi:hypothetical protein